LLKRRIAVHSVILLAYITFEHRMEDANESVHKKQKMEHNAVIAGEASSTNSTERSLKNFSSFRVDRVLNESARSKTIFLLGQFSDKEGDGILILEKTPFNKSTVSNVLSNCSAELQMQNDIYGSYQAFPRSEYNAIKATVIHPATSKHTAKYTAQKHFMIVESPEDYKKITQYYINSLPQFSMQWVYNILDHKSEAERIVYEDLDKDTGFVLLPDLKWDCKQVEDLYMVAIVQRRDIRSIRDLNDKHLPLLRNLQSSCLKAIEEKYKVTSHQLKAYIHYQPSYYHLHVHFTHLHYEAPGTESGRAHLLAEVISNIELLSDYYQRSTIQFTVTEQSPLYDLFMNRDNANGGLSQGDAARIAV